jgi:hypothetical protein
VFEFFAAGGTASVRCQQNTDIRGNAMTPKIALRVATLAVGTAALVAVPALAQDQTSQESKRQAAAERNHLTGVAKWAYGKKYYDYTGTMPPPPTQQEMQSRQAAAAKARHLHGVTKWSYGKKYTDYMPGGQSGM